MIILKDQEEYFLIRITILSLFFSYIPPWTCASPFLKPQSPGQPIGVTVHYTQQPIREQSLSSQPSQKLFQTHHPDEAPKPRLPDPIDHPIAVMPPSRM
ncbi:hypothetical protein TNCV_2154531 [Trichonephila clavipes]|nr:hypothetical protein TNCV_2154531 [Trichonephila clavipes]